MLRDTEAMATGLPRRQSEAAASGLPFGVEKEPEPLRLGPVAAVSFLVNACMGMGFLSLPYAFARAGLVASSAVVLGLSVLSYTNVVLLIDAMACVTGISQQRAGAEAARLMPRTPRRDPSPFDLAGRLDMGTMCDVLFGETAQRAFVAIFLAMIMIQLWGFAALVGSTGADLNLFHGPTCNVYLTPEACLPRYRLFLAGFGLVVFSLSLVEMREAQYFQMAMTAARTLVVAILLGDSVRMLWAGEAPPPPTLDTTGQPEPAHVWGTQHAHLLQVVAIAGFALAIHTVLPEVLLQMGDKRGNSIPAAQAASGFCALTYIGVGVSVGLAFGHWTLPVCTLNWANAHLGGWQQVLMLLPCFDLVSCYPIWAQCMAQNLRSATEKSMPNVSLQAWRALTAITPLIGAFWIFDVTIVATWAGLLSTVIVFVLPVLLWEKAHEESEALFTQDELEKNPYGVRLSKVTQRLILAAGVVVVCCAVGGAVLYGHGGEQIETTAAMVQHADQVRTPVLANVAKEEAAKVAGKVAGF